MCRNPPNRRLRRTIYLRVHQKRHLQHTLLHQLHQQLPQSLRFLQLLQLPPNITWVGPSPATFFSCSQPGRPVTVWFVSFSPPRTILASLFVPEEEEEDGNIQPGSQEENQSAKAENRAGNVQGAATVDKDSTGPTSLSVKPISVFSRLHESTPYVT